MTVVAATLCVVLLLVLFVSTLGDKHSLYYLYTHQSRNSSDRVSEFSAVTLLDDRQIDSYSSTDGVRTPKQDWMNEMKEREWKSGTEKLKYDGELLNQVDIHMKTLRHNKPDGHTLQWRVGCEGENHSGGLLLVLNCINEYGYDGQNLISYNWTWRKWSSSVSQPKALEEEWNAGHVDQRCEDCVHWLRTYLKFSTTDTKLTPPDVHVFAKKSTTNSGMLTLTCLATGFYPKDVEIKLRKFTTSLPEHLLTSSGVRPNDDGTYQLRKSVEIQEDEAAEYDCSVTHSSIEEPIIKQWDKRCFDCESSGSGMVGGVICGVVVLLLILGGIIFTLIKKGIVGIPGAAGSAGAAGAATTAATALQAPPNGVPEELLTADRKAGGGSDAGSDSGQGTGSTNSSNGNIGNGSSGNGHTYANGTNGAPATT
ncbi:H-2 class I histocompatibility antigen, alpha chain-like [Colossoma macropomum]|uniref:H-2 class I histocompatibility antigen, alpha chain-like n=1 Tax=Colossoma macropomum TaxID=42526 RepID=UPI001864BE61|nr:H-2 class I histocompatibility antigen, alpha chain-like [Colossoma macropomum]XP_036419091.1 H-2 class I histocompatibility antigen, alpha chain-like [Colossoma macropomum]